MMTRTNKYFNRRVIVCENGHELREIKRTVYEDTAHNFYITLDNKKRYVQPDVMRTDITSPDLVWYDNSI